MPFLARRTHYALALLVVLLLAGATTWLLMRGSAADSLDGPESVFDSIDHDSIGLPVAFRPLADDEAADLLTADEVRAAAGAMLELPMREEPKLVELVGDPFPGTPGANGPLWAFLPDIPPPGLGPPPEGVETFFLQLFDARTGTLVLEFGGPIRDGENEWHPDFPEELRYDREDQIR